MLAAIVLSLLGVGDDDIVADYGLTGLATERLIADWHAFYPGRELLGRITARRPPELMRVFLAELAETFGSVRQYVTGYLNVSEAIIAGLASRYTEAAS